MGAMNAGGAAQVLAAIDAELEAMAQAAFASARRAGAAGPPR